MQLQCVQTRLTAWILSASVIALNAFVVPSATNGNVLCLGEDGHIAVASATTDDCCDHDSDAAKHGMVRSADLALDCMDCIDLPLPDNENGHRARANAHVISKVFSAANVVSMVSFAGVDLHVTVRVSDAPRIPALLLAIRSVSLLI
jgi:hypothetical protein